MGKLPALRQPQPQVLAAAGLRGAFQHLGGALGRDEQGRIAQHRRREARGAQFGQRIETAFQPQRGQV